MRQLFVYSCLLLAVLFGLARACTNIIVSPGASADRSSIIAYNADSSSLYGMLYHYPAADHTPGSMRKIYDWDSGKYLGEIPEVSHTYNVVGNVNEYGVIIGETTFGGVASLQEQSAAILDYGSAIWVTLQRSTSAREAIQVLGDLIAQYGWASEGESFSIADQKEAWIMEIIGKGNYELGAVWVAQRVPDGAVTAHANQARIRTFPLNDPDNCVYAPDVISFARKIGLYDADKPDADFSFSDIYDAVTFSGARMCDARVWSVFSAIAGQDFADQYVDYAMGYNLTNRMPLFVYPKKNNKVSVSDTMKFMRNHYENSKLDMSGEMFSDVGAYTNSIYRAHPLTWSSYVQPDGNTGEVALGYTHERPIATPQTGWNFVAQSRAWLPRELSALLWFGVDDSGTTVRFPIYGSATRVPKSFYGLGPQDGQVPPMMKFSFDSAFYVFNLVANWAYTRWDLISPELLEKINAYESKYLAEIKNLDAEALILYKTAGAKVAVELTTAYSVKTGEELVANWLQYFGELFVKYRDGYIVTANPDSTACGCNAASQSYPQQWYDRIVKDTGSHYMVPPADEGKLQKLKSEKQHLMPVGKTQLKALQ